MTVFLPAREDYVIIVSHSGSMWSQDYSWEGKENKKESRCVMYVNQFLKMSTNFIYCRDVLIRF